MNNKRGIFFDLGNVLVQIDYRKFGDRLAELTGKSVEALRPAFADGLIQRYELGKCGEEELLGALCPQIGVSRSDFVEVWTSIFLGKPNLPDSLLEELSRRCGLWILSNTNRMHFDHIRRHYGFFSYMRGWVLSYEVGAAKPDRAIYLHALERAQLQPSEALFVDDSWINVAGARDVGIDAFQFVGVEGLIEEFRKRDLLSPRDGENDR